MVESKTLTDHQERMANEILYNIQGDVSRGCLTLKQAKEVLELLKRRLDGKSG